MKTLLLPLLFLMGVSFSGNAEQHIHLNAVVNVDCDQQALELYNEKLQDGSAQQDATDSFEKEYWGCMDDGGMSDSTVYIEG